MSKTMIEVWKEEMLTQVSMYCRKRDNMKLLRKMMKEVDIERFDHDPDLRALVQEMMQGVWVMEVYNMVQEKMVKEMLDVIEAWKGGENNGKEDNKGSTGT